MGIYLGGEAGLGLAPIIAASAAAGPAAPIVAPLALVGTGVASFFKGIIGAFSKRARVKTQTAAIADQGFPVLRDIKDRFLRGEMTRAQTLQLLDQMWGEMVRLWQEYDRVNRTSQGQVSITGQRVYFDQIRNKVLSTPDTFRPVAAAPSGAAPRGVPSNGAEGVLPLLAVGAAAYFLL